MEEDQVTFRIEITCPAKKVEGALYALAEELPEYAGSVTRSLEKAGSYEIPLPVYKGTTAKFSVKLGVKSR